jgi:hypothetical protein
MSSESAPLSPKTEHKPEHAANPPGAPAIHRVCVQCNNMFRVTPENFDAKQCPNCHKG